MPGPRRSSRTTTRPLSWASCALPRRMTNACFVNNVFDVAYATNIQSSSGTHLRFYNDPRSAPDRERLVERPARW